MNGNLSVDEYPDHLNPFDDNYDGVPEPRNSRHKYNTWSANRGNRVSTVTKQKEKPSFLEKPWAALNITPKGKLVRRMSFLKTTVARLSFRKKPHQEDDIPRSNSLHEDSAYRIISPKLKERLRLQALPALARLEQAEAASTDNSTSPLPHTRMPSLEKLEDQETPNSGNCSVNSPESSAQLSCPGPRPKTRKKKRPPPPPPPPPPPAQNLESTNGADKTEDNLSATSSITQDLEKGGLSLDDDSLAEFEFDQQKLNQQYD